METAQRLICAANPKDLAWGEGLGQLVDQNDEIHGGAPDIEIAEALDGGHLVEGEESASLFIGDVR